MNNLQQQPNIGKTLSGKLIQAGINTIEELKENGSEKAFLKIKTIDPTACIDKLYALEGAIQGIRWHSLTKDKKNELLLFFRMIELNKI